MSHHYIRAKYCEMFVYMSQTSMIMQFMSFISILFDRSSIVYLIEVTTSIVLVSHLFF